MTIETKSDLNQETIETLQDLIQANLDSAKGYREAAEVIDHTQLTAAFIEAAEQRGELAADLQTHVMLNGDRPTKEDSWLAAFHRSWMKLRASLNGGDPYVVLVEAERGEDYLKKAYEDALVSTAGSAMNDVLMAQYATVKQGHDAIRTLRDTLKATR